MVKAWKEVMHQLGMLTLSAAVAITGLYLMGMVNFKQLPFTNTVCMFLNVR